jgi:hypothetical protein
MNHPLLRAVLVVSLALTAGCASSHGGGSPDMETRTYRLRDREADAAVVNRVLEKEYERSGVRSSSSVTPNGDLMVQTTPRGHAAVRDALMREGR